MNSILKKNILKKEEAASTTLPHAEYFDVAVKTNQIMHAALNYAFQKLVDNDLYIEKQLAYESNYTEGPVNKDTADVGLYDDNTKFFDGIDGQDNNLSIIQKVPYDLSSTVKCSLDVPTRFLHDGIAYLAGADDGMHKSTDSMDSWSKLQLSTSGGVLSDCAATYLQDNYTDILVTTPSAVYKSEDLERLADPAADVVSCEAVFGTCDGTVNNLAAENGSTLFIGNSIGLYAAKKGGSGYEAAVRENTIRGNVADIEFLSSAAGQQVVVGVDDGSTKGLFMSKDQYSFYNVKSTYISSDIKYAASVDGVVYVAGSSGLSCVEVKGAVLSAFDQLSGISVNKIVKVHVDMYACTNDGVWKLDVADMSAKRKFTSSSAVSAVDAVDVCDIGEMTVVASGRRIYWTDCNIEDADEQSQWNEVGAQEIQDEILGLVGRSGSVNAYTARTVYTLDLRLERSQRIEPILSSICPEEHDAITTTYSDDVGKAFIGTTQGLYDEDFNLVHYADISYIDDPQSDCTITAEVTRIRYLNMFGTDIWCICTKKDGAYMLQEGLQDLGNEIWMLNSMHILKDKSVQDIAFDSSTGTLAAATDDGLVCLVIPTDAAEPFRYVTDDGNYCECKLNLIYGGIKTLASFNGKILVLDEVGNVVQFELFTTFSGQFTKTSYLEAKDVKDFSRVQTFATNQYAVETFARTDASGDEEAALYKLTTLKDSTKREFTKLTPKAAITATTLNKLDLALTFRHLISPTNSTIPKSICALPNDRYSEIIVVSTGDSKLSAYDIANMKLKEYANRSRQEPEDIYNQLGLAYLDPSDNVKVITADLNSSIKGICYASNTLKDNVIEQQKNMQCYIATPLSVGLVNTVFNCEESLGFKGIDAGDYPVMQQFSLIPYVVQEAEDYFVRKYIYVGIAQDKFYKYFENLDEAHDFDLGDMEIVDRPVPTYDAGRTIRLSEASVYKYEFSYDQPFNNTEDELMAKYRYKPDPTSEPPNPPKFVLLATSIGLLATVIRYDDASQNQAWFYNFSQVGGFDTNDKIPIDICRLNDTFYIATDKNVYTLDITRCELDGNKSMLKPDTNVNGAKAFQLTDAASRIEHIYTIGNNVYVQYWTPAGEGTGALYHFESIADRTKSKSFKNIVKIAQVPDTGKALLQTGTNNLSVFNDVRFEFSELSTEMQTQASVNISVDEYKEDEEGKGSIETKVSTTIMVSSSYYPCSADALFTQYNYVENKGYAYFATAWKLTDDVDLPDQDYQAQSVTLSIELFGISRFDGEKAEMEFDFNSTVRYDPDGKPLSDQTIADINNDGEKANFTELYLVRPADEPLEEVFNNKYGITYMFFSKAGDIFSGSYGFNTNEISNQLLVGPGGYTSSDIGLGENDHINCIDTITYEKVVDLYEVTMNHGEIADDVELSDGSDMSAVPLVNGETLYVEKDVPGDSVYKEETVDEQLVTTKFVWNGEVWKTQQNVTLNVSLAALGTTCGLRVKPPATPTFGEAEILDNADLDSLAKTADVASVSWSDRSITFLAKPKDSSKVKLVNIPYDVGVNGKLKLDSKSAKFADVADGYTLNDVYAFDYVNVESKPDDDQPIIVAGSKAAGDEQPAVSGVYEPNFGCSVKNEKDLSVTADILYQHENGVFIANGKDLSSLFYGYDEEAGEAGVQVSEYKLCNDICAIYESSTSQHVDYGAGKTVHVAELCADGTSPEHAYDEVANSLLEAKLSDEGSSVEQLFVKGRTQCYSVSACDGRDILALTSQTVIDTSIESGVEQLFTMSQQISNVVDYSKDQLLVVSETPMLVDRTTATAESYLASVAPEMKATYFNKSSKDEFVAASGVLYHRKPISRSAALKPVGLEIAPEPSLVQLDDVVLIDSNVIIVKNYVMSYDDMADVRKYERLSNKPVYDVFKVDDSTVLIGASDGLYKCTNGVLVHANALAGMPVHSISTADTTGDGEATYFLASGAKVFKTKDKNFMAADLLLDLTEAKPGISKITSVKKFGRKSYVIASDFGIMNTYDKYYFVDNWSKQTTDGISKQIKDNYDVFIQDHIKTEHGPDSMVTKLNEDVMPADMSEVPADWQTISNQESCMAIQNDYVDEVEFNGDVKYVTAEYSNFTTAAGQVSGYAYESIDGVSYVMKKYKSNIKELYIYVPTTGTQYINHVEGMQYCTNSNYPFIRSNATAAVSGTVADLKTKLRVWLDADHFEFSEIYNVLINGNSLPLKIFTDKDKHDVGESQQYFHSYMQPSIVNSMPLLAEVNGKRMPLQNVKNGKYFFDFSCFGTDAQSIKIIGKSPYVYTVVFDANEADSGMMADFKLREDQTATLPSCGYTKNGYVFKGWSLTKMGTVAYKNNAEVVNLATANNAVVKLYAVWQYYVFDGSADTVLTLKSTGEEFMLASSTPAEDAANIVVDYDYIGDTQLVVEPTGDAFTISRGQLFPGETVIIVDFED